VQWYEGGILVLQWQSRLPMKRAVFLSLPSWSVTYSGIVYDDARHEEDGIWHYRDIITREILRFARQDRVTVICKNSSPNPTGVNGTTIAAT
jgi:hypothetical protein